MRAQVVTKPGPRNLAMAAQRAFERFGDRESVFQHGAWFRSARLHERSLRLARGLAALGIRPGDRVVVFMRRVVFASGEGLAQGTSRRVVDSTTCRGTERCAQHAAGQPHWAVAHTRSPTRLAA